MKLQRTAWVLFLVLIALYLGLFWFDEYVPTQDGPCHLENALHLRDLCLPGNAGVERYYCFNPGTGSNLLYFVTVGAFAAVLPPFVAERLFLSLYLLAFAAATYAFARRIDKLLLEPYLYAMDHPPPPESSMAF